MTSGTPSETLPPPALPVVTCTAPNVMDEDCRKLKEEEVRRGIANEDAQLGRRSLEIMATYSAAVAASNGDAALIAAAETARNNALGESSEEHRTHVGALMGNYREAAEGCCKPPTPPPAGGSGSGGD